MNGTWTRINLHVTELVIGLRRRLDPVDERGGGRNTDEGFHISGGALVAGAITAGVAAFVAKKLGALG
jgi:hypothetical protein